MANHFLSIRIPVTCDSEAAVSVSDNGCVQFNGQPTDWRINIENERSEPVITVKKGFLVVDGVVTAHQVKSPDVITVEGNHLVVNGDRTAYQVKMPVTIKVEDDYLVVNTVKTKYKVKTPDLIEVEDGRLVVNGVATEYEIKDASHRAPYRAGVLYNVSADGSSAMVVGFQGGAKAVQIAGEYNGVPVRRICANAFNGSQITSISIPNSVTTIDEYAFANCYSLIAITVPGSAIIAKTAFFQP